MPETLINPDEPSTKMSTGIVDHQSMTNEQQGINFIQV